MFSFGSAAVTWSSKKQPTVASSSIEAKYKGASMATCEIAWLHKLLYDMHQPTDGPVVIYCDNMSDVSNDDISRSERHENIGVKCELSGTSDGQSNPVGKHVRSKKCERFIFRELHATNSHVQRNMVVQVRLPNLNVTTASDRILKCKSRFNANA